MAESFLFVLPEALAHVGNSYKHLSSASTHAPAEPLIYGVDDKHKGIYVFVT